MGGFLTFLEGSMRAKNIASSAFLEGSSLWVPRFLDNGNLRKTMGTFFNKGVPIVKHHNRPATTHTIDWDNRKQ